MKRAIFILLIAACARIAMAVATNYPVLPRVSFSLAAAGSTAATSVSVYHDAYDWVGPVGSVTTYIQGAPPKEWALCVVSVGGSATRYWIVDLELSLDDQTWTRIARHDSTNRRAGETIWATHRPARSIRLTLSQTGGGATITATAFGSP